MVKKLFNEFSKFLLKDVNYIVDVSLMEDDKIQELNKKYRNKDYIPDVLSFYHENQVINKNIPVMLGDLFISVNKVKNQAKEYGHSQKRELGFLITHGFLHLCGYDHQTLQEEKKMFLIQDKLLNNIKLKRH